MSAAIEGVGVGVLPDMSIPGMSIPGMSPEGVGGGPPAVASPVPESIPGMSIPGIPPASAATGALVDASPEPWSIPAMPDIPAMLDELELAATITNPTTAPAIARTTAEITIWLVPVLRVIEKVPKIVEWCRA